VTGSAAACNQYTANNGSAMTVTDLVRFDEHENPTTLVSGIIICTMPSTVVVLPATSSTASSSSLWPILSNAAGDVGGWLYLNLCNRGSANYTTFAPRSCITRSSQNWVVTSMSAEGRFETMFDATPLGNGCSPAPAVTNGTTTPIGPAP
jgi:hypothetical protein